MIRGSKRAFTLIELLVVISIIALIIALLLPALGLARESGRNVQCMSQVRQINLATITYTHEFEYFPACSGLDVIIDRTDEWGNVRQISERWPARLLPYLETTEAFTCPVKMSTITFPINTYYANTIFWTGNGQCTQAGTFLLESTQLDDVANPSKVVTYYESTRDWIGDYFWMLPADIKWWGDYSAKFQYYMEGVNKRWGYAGGRHFRTPSSVGGDPWGKDNIAMVDGHVRSQVSMRYLVDNEPTGVYHSFPFLPENEWSSWDTDAIAAGEPDVGVEFWTVPWW